MSQYVPHQPHPPQAAALLIRAKEVLYGGAAGGGKSDWLLMAALQYVNEPGYAALLLRRTYPELAMPGAIMDRAHQWLRGTDAHWNSTEHTYTFPSGATLSFGYLQHADDVYRYQSAEFQFIGFDELTAFKEEQYRYLFSRLRRLEGSEIPIRMRSATNPGGTGHEWVKQRFLVEGAAHGRIFIPARLQDNPSLDRAEYMATLAELSPVTRARLLAGDWEATATGGFFQREWLIPNRLWASIPAERHVVQTVRHWDFAATPPSVANPDPDWTVGARLSRLRDGAVVVEDIIRLRGTPQDVERQVLAAAKADGHRVRIALEQEPGASGVQVLDYYRRRLLGYAVDPIRPDKKKEVRAAPFASAVQAGNVYVLSGPWLGPWLDEWEAFGTPGIHDDQVDATSAAFGRLVKASGKLVTW